MERLIPVITYEYDIEIKRIIIKHITYPNEPTNSLKSPVIYGSNLKTICNILGMRYMSIDGVKAKLLMEKLIYQKVLFIIGKRISLIS